MGKAARSEPKPFVCDYAPSVSCACIAALILYIDCLLTSQATSAWCDSEFKNHAFSRRFRMLVMCRILRCPPRVCASVRVVGDVVATTDARGPGEHIIGIERTSSECWFDRMIALFCHQLLRVRILMLHRSRLVCAQMCQMAPRETTDAYPLKFMARFFVSVQRHRPLPDHLADGPAAGLLSDQGP